MRIHRVKTGETLEDIAKLYGTSVERILENNDTKAPPPVGRELLILMPTRTYRARRGDTLTALATRFGVKSDELMMRNPSLLRGEALHGKELAIKYTDPSRGTLATNAYFCKSTELSRLSELLPYITYLTLAAFRLNGETLERVFDPKAALRVGRESGKIVMMRVYDGTDGVIYGNATARGKLIEKLIATASALGFSGITLAAKRAAMAKTDDYARFLMELERAMIGSDLILFTEVDEALPPEISELADGSIFMYGKTHLGNMPSFEDGERCALSGFAENAETSKVFIDLPTEACCGGRYIPLGDALGATKGPHAEIRHDEATLTYRISGSGDDAVCESLENIKARLDLADELGFMGVSFDVGHVPTEYLMMLFSLFSPVHFYSPFSLPI